MTLIVDELSQTCGGLPAEPESGTRGLGVPFAMGALDSTWLELPRA
ncbi:hypothetical protein HNP02_002186 [Mycobacterium sp. AZCC_0083]|jgi:hypothetical protein|nr:hypothetical protein [Mycobacterium sp. AZCC_0083]